ncbi:hypothetical protein L1987_23937 [Smallanthus sonchifolius]|uniref:Uncharacterized protein n=1 Tax=Smallanthus sonchifolius TaxID=185202 RepID=A0ACB9IIV0_9ASTR|nr:hypothetical protein L1987_23937 [Smallanthus sonchifolius]
MKRRRKRLLYVDNFICGGMKIDTTVNAITYWNMKRLKLEIKGGGFGKGEYKWLTEVPINQTLEGDIFLDEMTDVERMLGVIKKEKNKIENTLGLMYEKHPDKEEVLSLIARYESLLEEKPTWPAKTTDAVKEANEIVDNVIEGLNVEVNCDGESNDEESTVKETVNQKDEDATAGKNNSQQVLEANFVDELSKLGKCKEGD